MSDATKKWLNEDEQELCAVLICRSDAESARTLDLVARLCSRLDAQQEVIGKLEHLRDGVINSYESHGDTYARRVLRPHADYAREAAASARKEQP